MHCEYLHVICMMLIIIIISRRWSDGQSASLWRYASEHARKVKAGKEQHSKETGRKV